MSKEGLQSRVFPAVLFVLIMLGAGVAFGQTGEQQPAPPAAPEAQPAPAPAPPPAVAPQQPAMMSPPPSVRTGEPLSTANKLRLQFELYMGVGLDSSKVGVTTSGEDVKISGGGGGGLGITLGYGLSQQFDIEGTLGVQSSGLRPAVKNADGSFDRSFVLATMKYKVPVRENLQWKFGLGAGLYQGELDINIDPGIPGSGHTVIEYKTAAGVHATGELEILLQERLSLAVGLKYYKVTYKAEKASFNGAGQPVASLSDEYRNFNGDGVDVTAGIGILF